MTLKDYLTTSNISSRPEEFQLFDRNGARIKMKHLKHFLHSEVSEAKVSDDKKHINVTIDDELLIFALDAIKEEEGKNTSHFFLVDSFYRPCITRRDFSDFVVHFYHKLKAEGTDYDIVICDRKSFELLSKLK